MESQGTIPTHKVQNLILIESTVLSFNLVSLICSHRFSHKMISGLLICVFNLENTPIFKHFSSLKILVYFKLCFECCGHSISMGF